MNRCPNCNFENIEAANFCSSCGTTLSDAQSGTRTHTRGGYVAHSMVTTTFDLNGYEVVRNLGVVRGIVVRSRSIVGTVGASLQTLVGGDISLFSQLCENTRNDAFERMLAHAAELGANAVLGVRYDATEIMKGVTEVLAYGTAVVVKPGAGAPGN